MKAPIIAVLFGLLISMNASASWFGNNNNGYYGDDSDWPEWTPMYWMEEMFDNFDDNDDDYYRHGPYGGGYAPYGYAPYAQPYGPQAQVPYAAAPAQPQVPAAQ